MSAERLAAALLVRDALLSLFAAEGRLSSEVEGATIWRDASDNSTAILRTPKHEIWAPPPPRLVTRETQAEGHTRIDVDVEHAPRRLPWGVEAWAHRRKVLSIDWSEQGETKLHLFKRGAWEQYLLARAANVQTVRE